MKKLLSIFGIVIAILVGLFILIYGLSLYWASPDDLFQNRPSVISVELGKTVTNDFGEIIQDKGRVVQQYELINLGTKPQSIISAKTSCACTTVKIQDQVFGMHSFKKPDLALQPQEKTIIEVRFDPALHGPFGKGSIQRTVTLTAEDGSETVIKFFAVVK